MNKEESDLNNLIGNLCELLIKSYYEANGIRLKKISPDTKTGRRFDELGIREFLRGHPKQARIMILLKEIKSKRITKKKWDMPDFIVLTPENDIQFYEIKKFGAKFSLSNITQRDSLKFLNSKNFHAQIIRPKLPMNKDLTPEEVLLLLQGKGYKGKEAKFVIKSVSSRNLGYLLELDELELDLVYEHGGKIKIYSKTKENKVTN
jgi:hypothetical protein